MLRAASLFDRSAEGQGCQKPCRTCKSSAITQDRWLISETYDPRE